MGARHTDTNTYTNFYTGFIYKLIFWNEVADLTAGDRDGTSTCSGTCSICPTTGDCLPVCNLD